MAASSSFGPVRSSTWRSVTFAASVAPASPTETDSTTAAAPPADSAANDFGRISTMCGPAPVNDAFTIFVPPNTAWSTTTVSPSTERPTPFVRTVLSSFTDRRPATSRPS